MSFVSFLIMIWSGPKNFLKMRVNNYHPSKFFFLLLLLLFFWGGGGWGGGAQRFSFIAAQSIGTASFNQDRSRVCMRRRTMYEIAAFCYMYPEIRKINSSETRVVRTIEIDYSGVPKYSVNG